MAADEQMPFCHRADLMAEPVHQMPQEAPGTASRDRMHCALCDMPFDGAFYPMREPPKPREKVELMESEDAVSPDEVRRNQSFRRVVAVDADPAMPKALMAFREFEQTLAANTLRSLRASPEGA